MMISYVAYQPQYDYELIAVSVTRIHSQYVEGMCHRRLGCRFGHNLHTLHNSRVLDCHRAGGLMDGDILQLLRENLAANSGKPLDLAIGACDDHIQRKT